MSDSVRSHRWQPTRLPRLSDSPGKNTGVDCHFLLQCMEVKSESDVAQSCLTLRDPMDCSLPGSSVHGIFQAGVLEWGAIAFSGSHTTVYKIYSTYTQHRELYSVPCEDLCVLSLSPISLFTTPWAIAHQAPLSMEFSRQDTGAGCHFLFQEIFPTCVS